MMDSPPDLVVSGINQGPNLGPELLSGTIGTAAYAAARRFPAIAVSAGIRTEEANALPVRYPSTLTAYREAADLVVRIVAALCSPGCDKTMASGVVVNINYPALAGAGLRDVLVLPPGEQLEARWIQTGTEWQGRPEAPTCQNTTETDTAASSCGYATVSVLSAARQLDSPEGRALANRLGGLNLGGNRRPY
jgi:5'-nucleotidase